MKKLFLLLLPVLFLASCKDEIESDTRAQMNTRIFNYLMDEGFGGAAFTAEEYKKTDLALKEIKEYTRLNDSLALYIQRYEELKAEAPHVSPAAIDHDDHGEHDELLEHYGGLIVSVQDRIKTIEKLYTSKNYLVKGILKQSKKKLCTPMWFYINQHIEVIAGYYITEECYECR